MITDIEPIADIFAVTVDRQRFPVHAVMEDQWNELFRELIGTIVVRAVGDQGRQAVGMEIGTDQVIGRSLRGRIGRAGIESRALGEKTLRPKRTVDLVGTDMEKARFATLPRIPEPALACRLQQGEGPDDIGLDKLGGTGDRPIHMRLGGKMDHRIDHLFGKQAVDRRCVTDIRSDKMIPWTFSNTLQVLQVTGVGQLIKVDQPPLGSLAQEHTDKIGTDEAASTCYQDCS